MQNGYPNVTSHIRNNLPALDYCGKVDGISVPIPHFGCLLSISKFKEVEQKLCNAKVSFIIEPQQPYEGKTGEQLTMFVFDYRGNPLEFKAFSNPEEIFK